MANRNDRLPQNVPGPWYTDITCIDCDLCRETAPATFRRDDDIGSSVVYRQPVSEEELRLAREAQSSCPSSTIGDDGEAVEPDRPTPISLAHKTP
ncbi:MAG TPA: ferredoxin [Verrucomicrobiae bacterium]|nr:ferredoxin [Verrucomicrobiae bacterium]